MRPHRQQPTRLPRPWDSPSENTSGLPLPSPMHESEKWKGSRSVVSNSSRPHGLQPTRLLCPWDFPGKSTGAGCHCFLVRCFNCAQLFGTLWTVAHLAPLSMGILQARILEWVAMSSSRRSSWPRDWTFVSYVSCIGKWLPYNQCHLGSPSH